MKKSEELTAEEISALENKKKVDDPPKIAGRYTCYLH